MIGVVSRSNFVIGYRFLRHAMGTGVTHTVLDRTSGIPLGHGDFHIFTSSLFILRCMGGSKLHMG
jgi:hypothetical protein